MLPLGGSSEVVGCEIVTIRVQPHRFIQRPVCDSLLSCEKIVEGRSLTGDVLVLRESQDSFFSFGKLWAA
ncbi:hypothetical protein A6X21_11430 [Planctopirus hydrillae]|uniref:Uncharacterized protein n=1 Tax=Planctopirus hydrillae TaxID=1841610 RepID=A0A1C3E6H4_9PLAN|nr:hypothetical protein A6X21_11430 [Planctopirus hydrillae]